MLMMTRFCNRTHASTGALLGVNYGGWYRRPVLLDYLTPAARKDALVEDVKVWRISFPSTVYRYREDPTISIREKAILITVNG